MSAEQERTYTREQYDCVVAAYLKNGSRAITLAAALDRAIEGLESQERLLRDIEQQCADQSERLQLLIDQLKEVKNGTA